MGQKLKGKVSKCYLVQVLDEEGNEVACEYDFSYNKKEAEQVGKRMVEALKREDE